MRVYGKGLLLVKIQDTVLFIVTFIYFIIISFEIQIYLISQNKTLTINCIVFDNTAKTEAVAQKSCPWVFVLWTEFTSLICDQRVKVSLPLFVLLALI